MAELNFSLLEHLPEGVVSIEADRIAAINARAKALLPGLEVGQYLPDTPIPAQCPSGAGTFYDREQGFRFTFSQEGEQRLIFFSPAPDVLPPRTEELLSYLRQCAAPIMSGLAAQEDPDRNAIRGLHGLVRTINNLELLSGSAPQSAPNAVEFVSLCRRLTMEAGGLLKTTRRTLRFECTLPVLFIKGDPALLERLLLELIANSIKVTPPGGEVLLELTHPGHHVLLTIRDGGSEADGRRLMAAMSGQSADGLPLPGQGAALGLEAAMRITRLHRGSLMVVNGPEGHHTALILPLDTTQPSVSMRTPAFVQSDGGLSPLLLGLCDLLPASLFQRETIL